MVQWINSLNLGLGRISSGARSFQTDVDTGRETFPLSSAVPKVKSSARNRNYVLRALYRVFCYCGAIFARALLLGTTASKSEMGIFCGKRDFHATKPVDMAWTRLSITLLLLSHSFALYDIVKVNFA